MKALHNLCGKKLLSLPILLLLTLSLLSALNVNMTGVSALDYPAIMVVPEITTGLEPGTNFTVSIYTDYYWFDIIGYQFTLEYNPDVLHGGIQKKDWDTWWGDNVTKTFGATLKPVVLDSEEVYVNEILMTRIKERTDIWTGDNVTKSFITTRKPVVPDSETVYVNKSFTKPDVDYTTNYDTGNITFMTAPPLGVEVKAEYEYGHYTIQYKTGNITFTTAPGLGVEVKAIYSYNGVVNGDVIVDGTPGSPQFEAGTFNNTEGTLSLTVGYFFTKGDIAWGPGTLANVTFTVVGKGFSNLTIGPQTKLYGYDVIEEEKYVIINAAEQPTHIQHGYFDNRLPHDVAVVSVTAHAEAAVGSLVAVSVEVANMGNSTEVANVTVRYDSTLIGFNDTVVLPLGESKTVFFSWDTTGLAQDTYTINATATIEDDGDPTDNWDTTTFLVAHDVAVVSVTAPDKAAVGSLVPISVEITNTGSFAEVANVTVRYDSTLIGFNDTVVLPLGESKTVFFSWDTTGVAEDTYTINATVTIPEVEEEDEADNWKTTTIRLVAHDVAVVCVTAPDKAAVGSLVPISVEITNKGAVPETVVDVAVSYDGVPIENKQVSLLVEESKTVSFDWDTTGVAQGNYTLNATATIEADGDLADNSKNTTILLVEHDVAVKNVSVTPDTAIPGEIVSIGVEVENIGAFAEVANVTVHYGSTLIGFNDTVELPLGETRTVSFSWDTTGVAQGNYTLNATATIEADGDLADNWNTRTILMAMHDVAVKHISVKASVYVGDLVTIRVQVENLGWYKETFDLKVTYDTTNIIDKPETVTLSRGASEYISFDWDTTGVPSGSYIITARTISDEDVNPDNDLLTESIIVNLRTGAIIGTVMDSSTSDPIEGANVTANGYSDITDADGHYTISDVPAGTYTVTASANGYEDSSQTDITVVAEETTPINFTLTPLPTTGNIAGIVTDSSTGDPIAGATVTANDMSATTNSSGDYTISDVPAGTYTVTASANGYEDSSQTDITVVAGQTTTVNLELTPVEPAQPVNILLYAGAAAAAIIIVAAIAVYILKVRKPT